jgi:glycerol uptake facilitator-like aquaporin
MEAKHTARYIVTAELQEKSVKQYFWRAMIGPRLGGFLILLGLLMFALTYDYPYKPWVVGFLSSVSLLLIAAWTKTYLNILVQAKTGLRLMEHPNVEIRLDDTMIEYSSSTGIRRHCWDKIDRVGETRDFLILISGKLPLLSLPKSCFSDEAVRFLRERVGKSGQS